jgi:Ca2+-binding RTX toxin-like protein
VLRGGAGDDVLFGGAGYDRLDGGEGDDTQLGGDGDDVLLSGPGADLISGGSGLDSFSYADRREPVLVTLGEDADDGTQEIFGEDTDGDGEDDIPGVPPEGDDVRGDVEIVRGGRSHDVLVGTGSDEELYGGAGDDEL